MKITYIFQFFVEIARPEKGRGPYLENQRSDDFGTVIRTPQWDFSDHFKVVIEHCTTFLTKVTCIWSFCEWIFQVPIKNMPQNFFLNFFDLEKKVGGSKDLVESYKHLKRRVEIILRFDTFRAKNSYTITPFPLASFNFIAPVSN